MSAVIVDLTTGQLLIRQGMRNAKLIGKGEEPDSQDYADFKNQLNMMLNFRQTQGLRLWLQQDLPITLIAGQALYILGPGSGIIATRPTRVLDDGYYLDQFSIRRPIFAISRQEWDQLSTPTQPGEISQFFTDKQQSNLYVHFWLTPDAVAALGTAHLIIQQQQTNIVQLTDQVNFPLEWMIGIAWGLAAEICVGQPQAIVDHCIKMADFYWEQLNGWDVEDVGTKFQPDYRGMGRGNSFT